MNPFAKSMHKCIHFGLRYVRKDFLEEKERERDVTSALRTDHRTSARKLSVCVYLVGGNQTCLNS
jgi:hypothetical protein